MEKEVGMGTCQILWMSQIKGGIPGIIPKKSPCPSSRTKVWIRISSMAKSLWRGGGVGLREARGRLRVLVTAWVIGGAWEVDEG